MTTLSKYSYNIQSKDKAFASPFETEAKHTQPATMAGIDIITMISIGSEAMGARYLAIYDLGNTYTDYAVPISLPWSGSQTLQARWCYHRDVGGQHPHCQQRNAHPCHHSWNRLNSCRAIPYRCASLGHVHWLPKETASPAAACDPS